MVNYAQQSIDGYKNLVAKNESEMKPTLLTKLDHTGREGLSDIEIRKNMQVYITFGSDTMAMNLCYLLYRVSRDPGICKRLVAEVSLPEKFTYKTPRDLPYLNQVIDKTLRLYSAVASALARAVLQEGTNLLGHHRMGDVFPEPDK